MTDFRDVLRLISGPVKPDALLRVARFLTAGQTNVAEGEMEPGLVQLADGTVWLVNPDLTLTRVGGGAGSAVVRGPFPFAFDTPGLRNGVPIGYTTDVDDILLDAWIEIDTAWDGTTPKGDIGFFSPGVTIGWWGQNNAPLGLKNADQDINGNVTPEGLLMNYGVAAAETDLPYSLAGYSPHAATAPWRSAPAKFTVAKPVKVCVSRTGEVGGADPGSTQGAGAVYLVTATPVT